MHLLRVSIQGSKCRRGTLLASLELQFQYDVVLDDEH